MTYVLIGLRRSISVCLLFFACSNFSFSPFRLFFHCAEVLSSRMTSSKVMHPGSSLLLSLLSEGRDGGGRSRDALVLLPEGFPLLPLDLVQREGWRSLWSRVWCTRARFCLLGSFVDWGSRCCSLAADSATFFAPVGSPSSSLHALRGVGEGEFSGGLSVLSCLVSARLARWWGGWVYRVPLQLGSSLAGRVL